jgi:hypothetical protein
LFVFRGLRPNHTPRPKSAVGGVEAIPEATRWSSSLTPVLLMRRTLHLVTVRDCVALRPVHQAILVSRMRSTLRRVLPGVDL